MLHTGLGWGSDLSQVNIDLPGHEMAIVIKPHINVNIHIHQQLAQMSSTQLAENYELIGICGHHHKAIVWCSEGSKIYTTNQEVDNDPDVWATV